MHRKNLRCKKAAGSTIELWNGDHGFSKQLKMSSTSSNFQTGTCKLTIDCTKEISVNEINYAMASRVINSWDRQILQIPDWATITGESFLRHIFRIEPKTITLFDFPADTKWDDPALRQNDKFMKKAIKLIKAIDMAVSFLGPDLEPLEEQLYRLGWQHIAMKALPPHWPLVGDALLAVFDDCMIGGFKDADREAWIKVRVLNDCFVARLQCNTITNHLLGIWNPDSFVLYTCRSTVSWDSI